MPVTEAKVVVDTVKGAIDAGSGAIDLYNKSVDQVIPWQTFEETVINLTKHEKDYSNKSGELVGKVKTLLLNSRDQYFKATQSVYEWCGISSNLLAAYLTLFTNYDAKKAEAQKEILLKVLGEGIVKMTIAQKALQESSSSFNEASGNLTTLNTQLKNDFAEGSSYYNSQVDKLRKQAYLGAPVGAIGGPFGLIISYSVAAGVVEGKLIPEMKAKFEQVKKSFVSMKNLIAQADKDIDEAKGKLQEEIKIIGDMKVQTETTQFYVQYDDLMLGLLKKSASDLISKCNAYMDRHDGDHIPGDTDTHTPIANSTSLTIIHTKQGSSSSNTDSFANYKTWDGSNWRTWIYTNGKFKHQKEGATSDQTDTIINYISWDGNKWSATIDPERKLFTHTLTGATTSHEDTILNYLAWDGTNWTMKLQ